MDFETALDPGCEMYAHDIAADKSLTGEVTAAIDLSVDRMKDLLRRNAFDSNAGRERQQARKRPRRLPREER